MNFFKEFLNNTKTVGAILPSSRFLAKKMTSNIDYKSSKVIVELGAGTGVFTNEIIKLKSQDTIFIIFEINDHFYNFLTNKYSNFKNVFILKEGAENLGKVLKEFNLEKVDYVVSGLPFLNFHENLRNDIFKNVSQFLEKEFILFQYTHILEKELKENFLLGRREKTYLNFPPAYVYTLESKI